MSRSLSKRLYVVGAICWLLAGVAVITIDGPLARFDVGRVPGDLRTFVQLSEVFAHGMGVGMILVAIWVLDRDRRRYIPRVACVALFSGILANVGKLIVARHRPRAFDLNVDGAAIASFDGTLGDLSSELQSFPSGHTATAVGFALALSSLYPRGRGLFAVLAILAASQRVLFDAHYVSDTLAGAGIACVVAAALRERLFWDVSRSPA